MIGLYNLEPFSLSNSSKNMGMLLATSNGLRMILAPELKTTLAASGSQ